MSVNKVILVGNLGQDPELRYTPSGASVCNFSIATSESWTDKASGQRQEKTEWHRIVVWNKQAEHCNQYLSKGRQVYVEGQLQTRSWEDANTGQKRYTTEVVARTVKFLGGARDSQGKSGEYQNSRPQQQGQQQEETPNGAAAENYQVSTDSNFTADDIPF